MSELHRHTDTPRLDIHNAQVNTAAAMRHLCGMTHLASGRLCLLPERHSGPCDFCVPTDTRWALADV